MVDGTWYIAYITYIYTYILYLGLFEKGFGALLKGAYLRSIERG